MTVLCSLSLFFSKVSTRRIYSVLPPVMATPDYATKKEIGLTSDEASETVEIEKELQETPHSRRSSALSEPIIVPEQAKLANHGQEETSEKATAPLSRTVSVAPSIVHVARSQRRGLLARLAIIGEITTPTAYPRRTKWIITTIVAVAGACAPMGSAILMPSLFDIARDLEATHTITNMSVAFYMLALGVFPLWWSSFSEIMGRRTIYLVSFTLFTVFSILCAISQTISMFIVMRILSGGAAASVQAVGAGTIADIWEPKERGRAMGIFYLGPVAGPFLSPIFGGALAHGLGWRSTQWFLSIYGGVLCLLILFALPETLKARRNIAAETTTATAGATDASAIGDPSTLQRAVTRQSVQMKTRKWAAMLRRCFIDPLKILLLLRFPAVAVTAGYASMTFGCLYFLNISIEETFSSPPYQFSTIIVGLLYIPNSIGYILGSIFGGRWLDYIMKREAKRAGRIDANGKLIFRPEDRMRENAWVAAIVFPLALVWYGWAVQYGVHWIVPVSTI